MSTARDSIRALFARWERLQDEKKAISDDLAELFKEAKGQGFDTKALRKASTIRRNEDGEAAAEFHAVCELYLSALGIDLATRAHAREAEPLPPHDPDTGEIEEAADQPEHAGGRPGRPLTVAPACGEPRPGGGLCPLAGEASPEGQGQTAATFPQHDSEPEYVSEVEQPAPDAGEVNRQDGYPELPKFLDRRESPQQEMRGEDVPSAA